MHSRFVMQVLKGELPSHIFMSVNQQNATVSWIWYH